MKMIIAFATILAVAVAAPATTQDVVLVKEVQHDNIGVDGYKYSYELSNGQTVEESAELKNVEGAEQPVIVVRGSYTFVDPQTNQRYTVTYTADESGFHPVGEHIPA